MPRMDHTVPLDEVAVSMNPYGSFYQQPHHPAVACPMRTQTGFPDRTWTCPHAAGYGPQHLDRGTPIGLQDHPQDIPMEGQWTIIESHDADDVPRYGAPPQDPWNGSVLDSSQNQHMPGPTINDSSNIPGHYWRKLTYCTHVAIPGLDAAGPHTPDSDVHEPITPEPDAMIGMDFAQGDVTKEYGFEDMLNFDFDLV
ncbi:MAG: hypothetical protein Q9168_007076, partial [Polycauliona sp. 1 TL-2023]